jgi:CheY-like chemotaxis protein
MRILIAEDDAALQFMAGKLMGRWGFEFDIASNGQEAVDQAQINEGKYDLCLMDIDMPIMNGLEATKIIRQNLKYFPIMALTGNLRAKEEYLAIGMDDFLEKPYSIDNLYQKINELTVKFYKFKINGKDIFIKKEMPMDAEHNKELIELAKQNLCKMTLKGHDVTVIVHKNVPNKIAHDFIEKELDISVFLDRNMDNPGECHLYKLNSLTPIIHFDEDRYKEKLMKEDEEIKQYDTMVLKKKKPSEK